MIFPKSLKKGDTIGIIAPASPYRPIYRDSLIFELDIIKRAIESFGYNVKFGETCYLSYKGYLAGEDDIRVRDLENMFIDENIDAVLCLRGGYGTPRILNKINYNTIKNNPKLFIGYSDITALHIAFNQKCNLVTYHGAMASKSPIWDEFTCESFLNIINMKNELIINNPENENIYTFKKGRAIGKIVGGNLSLIVSTIGTDYEINTKGKILFIEEIGESIYKIDRMMTQLELAGKLEDCEGIILGDFENCKKDREDDYELEELLYDIVSKYDKPCIYNLQSGHCEPMISIPLGMECYLDATNKVIKFIK